jgi:hypothetical protein
MKSSLEKCSMRSSSLALVAVACAVMVAWTAPFALLFSLPWVAAAAWVVYRGGWNLLFPRDVRSQAEQLPGFRAQRR